MHRFTDAKGEEWDVEITGATVKQLLGDPLHIDLGRPDEGDPPLVTRWDLDIAFKVDVLFETLRDRCKARGIDGLEFARRLKGESLARANDAFLEEWRDFFLPLRPDLAKVIAAARDFTQELMEVKRRTLEGPEFQRGKEQALRAFSDALTKKLNELAEEMRENPEIAGS